MKPPYKPSEWETVNCPFCNSDKFTAYEKFGCDLQFTNVKCKRCGLVYQSPRPKYDKNFIEAAYGEYFIYDNKYQYSKKEIAEYSQELSEIVKFDRTKTALLDVGSCMGAFLSVAQRNYSKLVGVEISENMAEFTRNKLGVSVHSCQFENLGISEKFSCIHMSHVIEHIPNPNLWMKKASELLTEGGVFVVLVPNMFSLSRRIKHFLYKIGIKSNRWKENWRTPDHLFEPTIKSMKYLCKQNGFRVLNYYTYSRKDTIANKPLSRIMQRKLKTGSNLRFYLQKV